MLFIQRELERIQGVLTSDERPERYEELYAAQQSLLWVLDSATFKSPHDMIVKCSPQDSRDCSAGSCRSESSDNLGHRAV
jgi:hypothetical protein